MQPVPVACCCVCVHEGDFGLQMRQRTDANMYACVKTRVFVQERTPVWSNVVQWNLPAESQLLGVLEKPIPCLLETFIDMHGGVTKTLL